MADLIVKMNSIVALEGTSEIGIGWYARTSDMTNDDPDITGQTQVAIGALASTINTAIKNDAITAAGNLGHTVGLLDKKNFLGGAVGL